MPENSKNSMLTLPIKQFDISLELKRPGNVSRFLAATIRGGFGYALRSLVCTMRDEACSECMLKNGCVYCFLLESVPDCNSPRLKKYKSIPRPFVIRPSQSDNRVEIKLILIGKAIQYLPYFIYTLTKLGEKGLGAENIGFTVINAAIFGKQIYPIKKDEIDMDFPPDIIEVHPGKSANGSVTLHFITPIIIRQENRILLSIDNRTFVATLLRRITNLNAFYGQNPEIEIDPAPYLKAAETLALTWNLAPEKQSRFSTRQQRRIDYSGFIGTAKIEGDIGTLMPLLKAGEILGIGKNTVFGMGKYVVEEIAGNSTDKGIFNEFKGRVHRRCHI